MSDWLVPDNVQRAGYHPVLRVVTQTSYKDTELGNRLLIDTLPADVRMRFPIHLRDEYQDISVKNVGGATSLSALSGGVTTIGDSAKGVLSSIKDQVMMGLTGSGKTPDDRPLEGCLVDSSFRNPSYHMLNVIFRNPTVSNPRGEELYGTDLLKVGFPIWVYIGYVDTMGNIVNHPFDPKPVPYLPLVFGGLVGSLLQEIKTEAGDRMIIQGIGYSWYLGQFLVLQAKDGTISVSRNAMISVALETVFNNFSLDNGYDIPEILKKAMRFVRTETNDIKPTIRYIYGATPEMHAFGQPSWEGAKREKIILGRKGNNYLQVLRNIERAYDVDIEWDANGYLTVKGKLDPFARLAREEENSGGIKVNKITLGTVGAGHEIRIHDAVLGGNVRDWSFAVDTEHVVTGIRLRFRNPQFGEPSDTYEISKQLMDDIAKKHNFDPIEQEPVPTIADKMNRYPAKKIGGAGEVYPDDDMFDLFGSAKRKLVDVMYITDNADKKGEKAISPWSEPSLKSLAKRLKHWGMRGEAMLIGNAHIREGDLIRVTDMRDKDGALNINLDVFKERMTSIGDRMKEEQAMPDKLTHPGKFGAKKRAALLGIKALDNVFYIWKVRHYIGSGGYWTKIYFIPHRESFATQSTVMRDLQRQSGRSRDDDTETVSGGLH